MPPYPVTITAGVTTGHVADSIGLHRRRRAADRVVLPEEYGGVGDGVALDTSAIVDALAAIPSGGTLLLSPGKTYLVAVNTINLISDLHITGGGTLKTTATTVDGAILTGASKSRIRISGISVDAPDDRTVLADLTTCTEVDFERVVCTKARLYITNRGITYAAANTNGGASTGGNVCRHIRSWFCTGTGPGQGSILTTRAFEFFHMAVGGCSVGDRIRGYSQGIQWWGGDANTAVDGAIANERKAGKFTVVGFNVRDVDGGAVWGSMGQDISVGPGHIEDCRDVGYDSEGGLNVTFTGGTARNCTNGGIATFWLNRNVRFEGMVVSTNVLNGAVAQIKNATQTHDNRDIYVSGSFSCSNGVGQFLAEAVGALQLDIMCSDVRVDVNTNNQGDLTAKGKMEFTRAAAAAFDAFRAGGNNDRTLTTDLEIITRVAQPANSRAIRVTQSTYAGNYIGFRCRGWGTTPITIESIGATGTNPATHLRGDLGEGTAIERIEGTNKSVLWWDYVTNISTNIFLPAVVPTTGYWDAGQRTADGKRCTVTGTPGTWV